jgi:hypothetical protein
MLYVTKRLKKKKAVIQDQHRQLIEKEYEIQRYNEFLQLVRDLRFIELNKKDNALY